MSKIICDVCGTAYPENTAKCPICGSTKRADANGNTSGDNAGGSSYKVVKGGRFSKANVRKRNQERQGQGSEMPQNEEDGKSNKGLIALMLILLGAVVAVAVYIMLRLFNPMPTNPTGPNDTTEPTTKPSTSATTEAPTTDPTDAPTEDTDPTDAVQIPCQGLTLHVSQVILDTPGGSAMLDFSLSPADTTDVLVITSSDETVVTTSNTGRVTAVGEGSAVVTISCGNFKVNCTVTVDFPTEPTTEPSTEPTEPSTESQPDLKLNRSDITFKEKNESWTLYNGNLPLSKIIWTSDDENVATFVNGKVVAVGPGKTTVHAEYEGVKVSCIIRCNWKDENQPSTEPTTEPTNPPREDETYTISHQDVSIKVGESFNLTLKDSSGRVVDVDWKASASGYVEISGNKITGASPINSSSFTVYVKIGNTTYSCIVRVK